MLCAGQIEATCFVFQRKHVKCEAPTFGATLGLQYTFVGCCTCCRTFVGAKRALVSVCTHVLCRSLVVHLCVMCALCARYVFVVLCCYATSVVITLGFLFVSRLFPLSLIESIEVGIITRSIF